MHLGTPPRSIPADARASPLAGQLTVTSILRPTRRVFASGSATPSTLKAELDRRILVGEPGSYRLDALNEALTALSGVTYATDEAATTGADALDDVVSRSVPVLSSLRREHRWPVRQLLAVLRAARDTKDRLWTH